MKYLFIFSIIFIGAFSFVKNSNAEIQRVSVGELITIGDFVYDDDYVATTTPCTISIYDVNNVLKVNAANMSSNINGWHYYDYTVPGDGVEGAWPTYMTCGTTNVDLIKADKTFIVKPALATQADINNATATIISNINTTVENASSSLATSLPGLIWNYGNKTLTSFGTLVSDIWNSAASGLISVGSIGKLLVDNVDSPISGRASLSTQESSWNIIMSNYSSVQLGKTYRAKVQILNEQSAAENPFATPTVTLYDAERNVVVSSVPMTSVGTGLYEYTYLISSGATQGVWETVISTEVENGKIIKNNDYWLVSGSPAQVIINSVTGNVPNASANLTITNEGLAGYEYQYEWCVVSSVNNDCGGGDDIYRGTGAKFINPGEDWNTDLTATVPVAGNYIFKTIVYFGTEKSGSSRTFTITNPPVGGGGGSSGRC